jgi:ubiquinone biosynthesis protein
MGLVLVWSLTAYGLRRIATWFIRDREARRAAVAHLRGRTLRKAFSALGATFVKLGQVLSTRPDLLDGEIIDELRHLQDRMPPFPFEKAKRIVEEDLGRPLAETFAEFDPKPVAAASVAQVHRARLRDGREVAVKVLRPDVRSRVRRDSSILMLGAKVAAWHPHWKRSDPVGHLQEFTRGILEQTDLTVERENYERFEKNFASFEGVRFPHVHHALSRRRVLVMEFIRGVKLDALPPDADRKSIADRVMRVIMKMCFDDGFVHADLHPGNLVYEPGGSLVIFDVGLVKLLDSHVQLVFVDFTKCLVMGTPHDFVVHLRRYHIYRDNIDWGAVERDVEDTMVRFRSQLTGVLDLGELVNHLYAVARKHHFRPLAELTLVMVGIVTAQGIGKQLHPEQDFFADMSVYMLPIVLRMGLPLGETATADA